MKLFIVAWWLINQIWRMHYVIDSEKSVFRKFLKTQHFFNILNCIIIFECELGLVSNNILILSYFLLRVRILTLCLVIVVNILLHPLWFNVADEHLIINFNFLLKLNHWLTFIIKMTVNNDELLSRRIAWLLILHFIILYLRHLIKLHDWYAS